MWINGFPLQETSVEDSGSIQSSVGQCASLFNYLLYCGLIEIYDKRAINSVSKLCVLRHRLRTIEINVTRFFYKMLLLEFEFKGHHPLIERYKWETSTEYHRDDISCGVCQSNSSKQDRSLELIWRATEAVTFRLDLRVSSLYPQWVRPKDMTLICTSWIH